MRLTITHKLIFTMLVFATFGIGIIVFLILPSLQSITETSQAISSHVQSENDEFERIRLLRRSLTEIGSIDTKLEKTTKISATKSEEEDLIEEIDTIAKRHGVDQVLSVSYHAGEEGTEFSGYYLFSFNSAGLWENVRAYFAELESLPYYLNIKRVAIEKTPKLGDEVVTISFSATLKSSSEL